MINFGDVLNQHKNMMKNGFLLPIFNLIIRVALALNLVEYFKKSVRMAYRFTKNTKKLSHEDTLEASNIAIDIYQLFKFGVLFSFWALGVDSELSKHIVYYLLASNLFTYFYNQVWGNGYSSRFDRASLNRRFLNTLLAITYYLLCYAYLYQYHFNSMIDWLNSASAQESLYVSISTAFTLTYAGFSPKGNDLTIYMVFLTEILNTFFFLTIIISNSIPAYGKTMNYKNKI
ncbi:hypothetical protein Q8E16_000286 [Vibrio alginolyticus]|nr:hypothetical protein [Vibrio alginolyticus]